MGDRARARTVFSFDTAHPSLGALGFGLSSQVMTRKSLVAAVVVLLNGAPQQQITTATLLVALMLVMHLFFRPHKEPSVYA